MTSLAAEFEAVAFDRCAPLLDCLLAATVAAVVRFFAAAALTAPEAATAAEEAAADEGAAESGIAGGESVEGRGVCVNRMSIPNGRDPPALCVTTGSPRMSAVSAGGRGGTVVARTCARLS